MTGLRLKKRRALETARAYRPSAEHRRRAVAPLQVDD
jgi:hypothetical protein